MKLLQCSWSEILVLDLAHRIVRETWSGDLELVCLLIYKANIMSDHCRHICGVSLIGIFTQIPDPDS